MPIIPHSRPTIGKAEAERVANVIQSAHIAQGKEVKKFEQAFAAKTDVNFSAATSSGTASLHLILLAMGVGPGDEIVIPSFVCTALLNSINYTGALPVFADIDPETYNLDSRDVKARLTRRTKAVIVPHLFGLPANMESLVSLGLPVIEDCAQTVGNTWNGKPVGSNGSAAIFSFYATKVMATGEGGMVVSNSRELIDRVKDLREYDKTSHYKVRYNYKMTDLQAAIGLVQLNRLNDFIKRRITIARRYDDEFGRFNVTLPVQDPEHIYYRYIVKVKADPEVFIQNALKKGVAFARPIHKPIHHYFGLNGFPQTESAWRHSLSIPIYPSLTNEEVDRIVDALQGVCKGSARE